METLAGFRAKLAEHEGNVPYLYLDANRLPTVGIGHLTTKEMLSGLPFVHKNDPNKSATLAEKNAEFDLVNAASTPRFTAASQKEWYEKNITLILKEDAVNKLFDEDLVGKVAELKQVHPNLHTYSDDVRYALLDLIYNVGSGGLRKFVQFNKAVDARKFDVAAEQSHRKAPVQEARNQYVKRLLLAAAKEELLNPKQPSAGETTTQPSGIEVAKQIRPTQYGKTKPTHTSHTSHAHHPPHKTAPPGGRLNKTAHHLPQGIAHTEGTKPFKPHRSAPAGHSINTHRTGHRR